MIAMTYRRDVTDERAPGFAAVTRGVYLPVDPIDRTYHIYVAAVQTMTSCSRRRGDALS